MNAIAPLVIDKSKWPPGPWHEEPDFESFRSHGLHCLIIRIRNSGHLCGYVGVPPGHPMHGKHYSDIEGIEIHGGLTYSDALNKIFKPEPGAHYFGFDCAHYFDLSPGMLALLGLPPGRDGTYRTFGFVREEVKRLAAQLQPPKP